MAVPIVTIPFVISHISLEVFGVVSVYLAYLAVASHITLFSMNIIGPQYILQGDTLFYNYRKFVIMAFRTLITTLVYFGFYIVVSIFEPRKFEVYEYLIFYCSYFASLLNYSWYFYVKRSSSIFLLGSIIVVGLTIFLISTLNYFDCCLPSYLSILVLFAAPIGSGLVSSFYYVRHVSFDNELRLISRHVLNLFKENVNFYFSQLVSYIYVISSPIVLSFFIESKDIALYYIFEKVTFGFLSIGMLVYTYKYADLVLAYNRGITFFFKLSLEIYVKILFIIFFLFLTFFLLKNDVMSFFTGGKSSLSPFLVLLGFLYSVFSVLGSIITVYMKLRGNDRRVTLVTLLILVCTAFFGYVLLSVLGVLGWILGMVIGQSIGLFYFVHEYKESRRCVE